MSEAVLLMFFNMKSDERSVNIYRLEIETFEIHLNCHQKDFLSTYPSPSYQKIVSHNLS